MPMVWKSGAYENQKSYWLLTKRVNTLNSKLAYLQKAPNCVPVFKSTALYGRGSKTLFGICTTEYETTAQRFHPQYESH